MLCYLVFVKVLLRHLYFSHILIIIGSGQICRCLTTQSRRSVRTIIPHYILGANDTIVLWAPFRYKFSLLLQPKDTTHLVLFFTFMKVYVVVIIQPCSSSISSSCVLTPERVFLLNWSLLIIKSQISQAILMLSACYLACTVTRGTVFNHRRLLQLW